MMIARKEASKANPAVRRAQMASREVGSEWMKRRAIGLLPHELEQMLLSAAQSA